MSEADLHPSPDAAHAEAAAAIGRLAAIMARLRDPSGGCAWDIAQTFSTIAPYTIEEAYEVADAITRDDMGDLCEELGDLQLQVVFHARMGEERGAFTLTDVIAGICDKMMRRHPHVFAGADSPGWETIKAAERAMKSDQSALAGVALSLPALARAEKLQKRAARTGFDWPNAAGARAKITEELAEVEGAAKPADIAEEIGDLLFSVVNWARHLGVDPEAALRSANDKFAARFRAMEAASPDFATLSLAEKDALWGQVKRG